MKKTDENLIPELCFKNGIHPELHYKAIFNCSIWSDAYTLHISTLKIYFSKSVINNKRLLLSRDYLFTEQLN